MAKLPLHVDQIGGEVRIALRGDAGWEATLTIGEKEKAAKPLLANDPKCPVEQGCVGVHRLLDIVDMSLRTERVRIVYDILFELESRMKLVVNGMGESWRGPVTRAMHASRFLKGEHTGLPWTVYASSGMREGFGWGAPTWKVYVTFSSGASDLICALGSTQQEMLGEALVRSTSYYLAVLFARLESDKLRQVAVLRDTVHRSLTAVKWNP